MKKEEEKKEMRMRRRRRKKGGRSRRRRRRRRSLKGRSAPLHMKKYLGRKMRIFLAVGFYRRRRRQLFQRYSSLLTDVLR